MKIELNKTDLKRLKDLIEIKYINMSVSNMFEEFNAYYGLVDKKKIESNQTTFLNEFLNYFEIDFSDKENVEIIEKYIKPAIREVDNKILVNNPYFQNIKIKSMTYGKYALEFDTYYAYQTFAYDDVVFEDDFSEIYQIGYSKKEIKYPAISKNNIIWMCITPNEILTMQNDLNKAHGRVLTFGLGLGYYAYMASLKEDVESITIIEFDQAIIDIFNEQILPQFKHKDKITIVKSDAFRFMDKNDMNSYDHIFVDIYHGANDGLPLYLRFKKYENTSEFSYWLENSILGLYRRLVMTVIEECLEGYNDDNYKTTKTSEDKIINEIYFKLKNKNFNSFDEIYNLLTIDGLKKLIKMKSEN
ncbi:MAG: hypothetical protein J1F32_02435 [Erysipelotrichales bacterium]|nr:hypothetical protein [Erysipelotrichales bacterium]